MSNQIQTEALRELMERNAVKVVDGSWALDGGDMHALFISDHIPGAQFFDIETIGDHTTPLPHMAPQPQAFADAVGRMGISAHDHVVIYDRQGLFSAARVWWTFRLMGHNKVEILRGGLPAWKAAGFAISDKVNTPVITDYIPIFRKEMVINLNGLRRVLNTGGYVVLDARPQARFDGKAPEPRAGLRSGHMPGARSLPSGELIRDGALKPVDEIQALFAARGVGAESAVVTSCGSGVTAAILALALDELGHDDVALYDGSWAEWGQATLDTPVIASES